MKRFKFNQYICLKPEFASEGSWGYIVDSYDYENGELCVYSGSSRVKHPIHTLKDSYQKHILSIINEGEKYSNFIGD